MQRLLALTTVWIILATSAQANVWVEQGDAPDGPLSYQHTIGNGPLTAIDGGVSGAANDLADTYRIIITDPDRFYASTKLSLGGIALNPNNLSADTVLFLWDLAGNPLLANDSHLLPGFDFDASTIASPGFFPTITEPQPAGVSPSAATVTLVAGESYLLTITSWPNYPRDSDGVVMFESSNFNPEFLFGRNPNSVSPFASWSENPVNPTFNYRIALQGATFSAVPEPGAGVLLACVLGGLAFRPRNSRPD